MSPTEVIERAIKDGKPAVNEPKEECNCLAAVVRG